MSGGVRTALDQAIEAEADMGEIIQAGLFEELEPCETGALDAPSPLSAALPSAGRKPGRPKGSKNRRTEAVTAWLLTQHRHPLSVMMEAYSRTPIELAETLGLQRETVVRKTRSVVMVDGKEVETIIEQEVQGEFFSNDIIMDLIKLQLRMSETVAPYVAQKLPQAVQLEGGASLTLAFGGVQFGAGGVSDPARTGSPEISTGPGMAVRLGQVGRQKSDDDASD